MKRYIPSYQRRRRSRVRSSSARAAGKLLALISMIYPAGMLFPQALPGTEVGELPDSSSISYNLNNNTSQWVLGVSRAGEFRGTSYRLRESLLTTRLELGEEGARWKDDFALEMGVDFPVGDGTSISTKAYTSIFKDRHTGLFNDSRVSYGLVGIKRDFLPRATMSATVGPVWDSRREQQDAGYRYAITAVSPRTVVGEWRGSGSGLISADIYDERRNDDRRLRIRLERSASAQQGDTLEIILGDKRRDYYVSEAGDIESRIESTTRIRNSLSYPLGFKFALNWAMDFSRLETEIESPAAGAGEALRGRRADGSDNVISLKYDGEKVGGRFAAGYRSYVLNYSTSISGGTGSLPQVGPDNKGRTVYMSGRVEMTPTGSDSVLLSVSSNRLRFDTPDERNFDDRDELRLALGAGYAHAFGQDFKVDIRGVTNLDHVVYIFGERSADNYWNRVFALRTSIKARLSSSIWTRQSFGVRSNYYDYDYDDILSSSRSLVLRNFSYFQTTQWRGAGRWNAKLLSRFELEEDGKLDWGEFIEEKVAERRIYVVDVSISCRAVRWTYLSAGISKSSRKEWRLRGEGGREEAEDLDGFGPVFELRMLAGGMTTASLRGRIQRVENIHGNVYYTKAIRLYASLQL